MQKHKLYTLSYFDFAGCRYDIQMNYSNPSLKVKELTKKVPLDFIDKSTTKFENRDHLLSYLNNKYHYSEDILETIENGNKTDKELAQEKDDDDTDPLLMEAIDTCVELGQASTSFIQRRFKVGYARAGRIIDQMEARGIISGYEGSKPRQVLITLERLNELKMAKPPAENTEG